MSSLIWLWYIGCAPSDNTTETSCWQNVDNTWTSQMPPKDLTGSGFEMGETPPDMCMKDQFGNDVSLWQFFGQVVLLDVSSEWSGPSQVIAPEVQTIWTDYKDQGFMYLTLLTEDRVSAVPSVETLEQWAEEFSITAPVLSDAEGYREQLVPSAAYPKLILFNRTMNVINDSITPVNADTVRRAIENSL